MKSNRNVGRYEHLFKKSFWKDNWPYKEKSKKPKQCSVGVIASRSEKYDSSIKEEKG